MMKVAIQTGWGRNPTRDRSYTAGLSSEETDLHHHHQSCSKVNFRCVEDMNTNNLKNEKLEDSGVSSGSTESCLLELD